MARDGWSPIATHLRAEEAEMLRALLYSVGIEALVEDAAIAGVNPLLQSAVGGAKVLVPDGDAEAAATLVRESGVFPGEGGASDVEIPEDEWSRAPGADAAVPAPPLGREAFGREKLVREALGRRALAVAAVALLLSPTVILPLFALAVALRFWRTPGPASPRARVSAWAALVLDAAALALAAFFWIAVAPRLAPPRDSPRWPLPAEPAPRRRPFP